jgi:hypothetical protein
LSSVAAPIRAFVLSREGLEAPDVQLGRVPMLTEPGLRSPKLSRECASDASNMPTLTPGNANASSILIAADMLLAAVTGL